MANLCSQSGQSHHHYHLSRACVLGFPGTLALARLYMQKKKKKGTVGSCLKALQPAASGRYDMPKTVGLSGVHEGSLSYLGCSGLLLVLGSVPRVSGDLASSLVSNSDPA